MNIFLRCALSLLLVSLATTTSANMTLTGVGSSRSGGGGLPPWVATACPNGLNPQICIDATRGDGMAWSGISNALVPIASLMPVTRTGTESYQDASGAFSSIPANTLAIGSAGLQIQGQLNTLPYSTVCASATGGTCTFHTGWGSFSGGTLSASPPSGYVHNVGDSPDGTDSDTITFPTLPDNTLTTQSGINNSSCGIATAAGQYFTGSFYAQAVSSNPTIVAQLSTSLDAGNLISPPAAPNWKLYSITGITRVSGAVHIAIGTLAAIGQKLANAGNAPVPALVPGGTVKIAMAQCNPGTSRIGNVATTGAALTSTLVDNISATGDLATALHAAAATVQIKTSLGTQLQAGALLGNGGSTFLGKSTTDKVVSTSSLATVSSGLWNTSKVYTGVTSPQPVVTMAWGTGAGTLSLNGAVVSDATSRSLSGTVFLGSADGTASPCNCNIVSLEVDAGNNAPVASASQPITGVTLGGLLNFNGIITTPNTGTSAVATANNIINYNLQGYPGNGIQGDTFASAWSSDGLTYMTAGDTNTFGGGGSEGVFFGSVASPGYGIPIPAGSNGVQFHTLLGTFAQTSGTCPAGYGGTGGCEWKPASMLALGTSFTGAAHDMILLMLSRQWEAGSYGAIYSSVSYDVAEDPPWATLANWQGFPATNNGDIASTATFGSFTGFPGQDSSPWPFGIGVFVSNGNQDYSTVSGNSDSMNEYLYALESSFSHIPGFSVAVRIAKVDVQADVTSLKAKVDAAGGKWCYYGMDAAWHGGGTGCVGGTSAWTSVGSLATNATPPPAGLATNYQWMSATYVPASKRYLLTGHIQGAGIMVAAEAPHPWGPYTVISAFPTPSLPHFYDPAIVPSSVAVDGGRTLRAMLSGQPTFSCANACTYTLWEAPLGVLN